MPYVDTRMRHGFLCFASMVDALGLVFLALSRNQSDGHVFDRLLNGKRLIGWVGASSGSESLYHAPKAR
jgi:hypothetical protein